MTLSQFYRTYDKEISRKIHQALNEDSIANDVTSSLVLGDKSHKDVAEITCKENCVLAGIHIVKKVFDQLNSNIRVRNIFQDGDEIPANTHVIIIEGPIYDILRAERTALNFLQRMSGIATITSKFVRRLKYKNSKILHTRKTTPNFRLFEVAAVKIGGGDFHRLSLNSAVLIKDNHIKAAGSIEAALSNCTNPESPPERGAPRARWEPIEIEVQSMSQLREVLTCGKGIVQTVLLDNFTPWKTLKAVRMIKKNGMKIELSGGINEKNFDRLQHAGIDFYSIGMLTHSYKSINFSMDIVGPKIRTK
jgi:nicotinate-nucleotide pyrophosphorylase (carboxylating)